MHLEPYLESGTLFVTVGTLECFTPMELETFLEQLPVGSALGLCEPVNLDVHRATESSPRGLTLFSHPYLHSLRKHGLSLLGLDVAPIRADVPLWQHVTLLAVKEPRGDAPVVGGVVERTRSQ